MKYGETPKGYWVLLLLKVWLPKGMVRSARSSRASEFL
jgi:hypothetical protein